MYSGVPVNSNPFAIAQNAKIDLSHFCAEKSALYRHAIWTPWMMFGKVYATDAVMLVECDPERAIAFEVAFGPRPDVLKRMKVFKTMPGSQEFNRLPAVKGPESGDPRWRESIVCHECCKWDPEYRKECDACSGEGKYDSLLDSAGERVPFMGSDFARRYLWLVALLPRVWATVTSIDEGAVMAFKFDGGRGLLMSLKEV